MYWMASILFWVSLGILIYHYVVYPKLVSFLARNKHQNTVIFGPDELPFISILLAVYNEEQVMVQKIKSTFETHYPLDKIQFLIGSDASTDRTEELIEGFQDQYPQIELIAFGGRSGKPQIINELQKHAKGTVLVMTDANVFFEQSTLLELVKHYKNPTIGLVGGNILNLQTKTDGISKQEKKYLNRENQLKYHQGILSGQMMGAFGGLYSVRKSLYQNVPKGFIVDDFYITLQVLSTSHQAINELEAIAYEDVSNIPSEEFRRKIRIGTGNFQNLFAFKSLLLQPGSLSFHFLSHKVFRWKGPVLLLTALCCAAGLAQFEQFYLLASLGIVGLVLTPVLDGFLKKLNIHLKLLRYFSHFVMMNLALLIGFFKFVLGESSATWTPTKRNQ